jgi:DNA-binding transcriptional regulator LsrR (DeoR family)
MKLDQIGAVEQLLVRLCWACETAELIQSELELMVQGGVGNITGHILDAEGAMIEHAVNPRATGILLDNSAKIDNVCWQQAGCIK